MKIKPLNRYKIGECYLDNVQYNEKSIKLTLTYIIPSQIHYTINSAYHIPAKEKYKILKISDWVELDDIKSMSLVHLKELLLKNIEGIDVEIVQITTKITALKINWNNIRIEFVEDSLSNIKNKRSPIPVRILVLLEQQPNYIVKGREGFIKKLGMNFSDYEKVVYVGEGATYYFNANGFKYIGQDKLRLFRKSKCKDLIGIVEHREEDNTRKKLIKKTNRYLNS